MDSRAVLALCHEHANAEAALDIDRVLATLAPVPSFEFFPLRKVMAGRTTVERFYREQYPRFVRHVVGFELLDEWVNEHAALQEYVIDVVADDADNADIGPASHRVMSIMPIDEDAGLLAGERLYCDEAFVRVLLGPLFALLSPLER